MITPILIAILIGTVEVGAAFKDYLNVSYTSREAARVGALAGNDSNADCAIVHSIVDSLSATNNLVDLVGLQIYQADPNTGARIPSKTNTWILVGSDPYDCANDWTIVEKWPATSRKTTFGPSSQLDILGVRVAVVHNWMTGFPPFNGSFWVDEQAITRMEPEAFA